MSRPKETTATVIPGLRYEDAPKAITQAPYVIVDDCDAHYQRARSAGAEIVLDLETQEYGGSGTPAYR